MNDDQFTPDEQQLIDLLRNVSQPKLNAGIAEAIRQKMLAEMDKPVLVPAPRAKPLIRFVPALAAAAAVGLIFVFVLLSNWQRLVNDPNQIAGQHTMTPSGTVEPTMTEVMTLTPTAVEPTETLPGVAATDTPVIIATVTDTPPISMTATDTPMIIVTATDLPVTVVPATATDEIILPSPTPTSILIIMTPIPTLETVLVLEGAIEQIDANVLTINGLEIEVLPDHPVLQLLEVDDQIRVEGGIDESGAIVAAVVATLLDDTGEGATIGLEGPVEKIDENIVTVNGISVELADDDPRLTSLRVGDFLSVQGNFVTRRDAIVLVVVKIQVLAKNGTGLPANCRYQDKGNGKGHWRCNDNAPGNSGNAPGNSGNAPGNSGNAPGNSGNAPGNSGNAPGNSGNKGSKGS